MIAASRYLSPPELAQRYRCKPAKIITWIESGELRAVNLASNPQGRPRWRIAEADIVIFEEQRAARPAMDKPIRRRQTRPQQQPAGFIEYFK